MLKKCDGFEGEETQNCMGYCRLEGAKSNRCMYQDQEEGVCTWSHQEESEG